MASEYYLALDENRGRVKQHLLSFHLALIKWLNKCTLPMAIKSTGDFHLSKRFHEMLKAYSSGPDILFLNTCWINKHPQDCF